MYTHFAHYLYVPCVFYDVQNFINAASFARRLLELPDMNTEKNVESRGKAQKVLQKSEQQGRNEYTIDYDERNPFRYVDIAYFCFSFKYLFTIGFCLFSMIVWIAAT